MRKQMYWVLRTYLANKLFLAVLAYACLTVTVIVAGGTLDSKSRVVISFPWFAGIGPAALAIAVGGVLAQQLRVPVSQLSPRFVQAHAGVAAMWLAAIVAGVTWCTWLQNQPWLLAAAFSIGVTGFMFGMGVGLVKPILGPTTEFRMLDKLLGLGTLLMIPLLVVSFGGYLSGLLSGVRPTDEPNHSHLNALLTCGLLFVGTGFAWRACQTLRTLTDATSTFGSQPGRSAAMVQSSAALLDSDRYGNLLQHWSSSPPHWTLRNRVMRWRIGNPLQYVATFILAGTIGVTVIYLFLQPRRLSAGLGAAFPMIMLFVFCTQVAANWRKRVTCLDVESLRPVSRSRLQSDWAIALVFDLLQPALAAGFIATIAMYLQDEWFSTFAWRMLFAEWASVLVTMAILTGVLWLAAVGLASTFIIVERQWLGFVIAIGLFAFGGGAFGASVALLGRTPLGTPEPKVLLPLLLIPATLSAVVIACMWRLWIRMDFDRRS